MWIKLVTLISVSVVTIWDIKTKRIPNFITFSMIVAGLVLNTVYSGLYGFENALLGLVIGTALFSIPFAFGGMGAGDVKLLAAIGALNGPTFAVYTFLYGAVAGGLIAVVLAVLKGQLQPVLFNSFWTFQNFSAHILSHGQEERMPVVTSGIRFPYGIAIFLGVIMAYWLG